MLLYKLLIFIIKYHHYHLNLLKYYNFIKIIELIIQLENLQIG